ncbi:MAG: class I SAM-dependent methyltransferase [Patescibacteria group bacterium]
MQHSQSRPGPAFARRGKGTYGTQRGNRSQGAERIDRAPRDARADSHADGPMRPSVKPPFMKGRRRDERFDPLRLPLVKGEGSRCDSPLLTKEGARGRFNQRTSGPRAAASPRRGSASSTSWENVAEWYGTHLSAPGTYQSEVVWPGALKLLGVGAGKVFLDVACGEGSFAQLISKQGGGVVGIDASPTLVRQAQMKHVRNAEFFVSDASRGTKEIASMTFDGAAIVLALQNIENMEGVFATVSKLLKKNAPFVIVLNHPAFRVPRQSSWGFEDSRKMMYRRIDSYLEEKSIPMQMHPGDAPDVRTMSFHRPLSSYVSALSKAGFLVDEMEEWISHKESTSGPRARAENRIRKEIPMFLAIRARKV